MRTVHRMIAVTVVSALLLSTWPTPAQEKPAKVGESGFKPLFDLPKFWIYNGENRRWAFSGDGVIVSEGEGGGWLMHPQEFGDLELRLEYKMRKGGNSGVTLRCPLQPPQGITGIKAEPGFIAYEIQLVDDDN
jgi:3-keto-disaccharide hydrolase